MATGCTWIFWGLDGNGMHMDILGSWWQRDAHGYSGVLMATGCTWIFWGLDGNGMHMDILGSWWQWDAHGYSGVLMAVTTSLWQMVNFSLFSLCFPSCKQNICHHTPSILLKNCLMWILLHSLMWRYEPGLQCSMPWTLYVPCSTVACQAITSTFLFNNIWRV